MGEQRIEVDLTMYNFLGGHDSNEVGKSSKPQRRSVKTGRSRTAGSGPRNQAVDLTYFTFLGGKEGARLSKRSSKKKLPRSKSSSKSTRKSKRVGTNQPVDLTYFKFMGGREAGESLSKPSSTKKLSRSKSSRKSTRKSKKENIEQTVDLTYFKFMGGREAGESLSKPSSTKKLSRSKSSRKSARKSKKENIDQTVDLTYFKFLGGREGNMKSKSGRSSSRKIRTSSNLKGSRHRSRSTQSHSSSSKDRRSKMSAKQSLQSVRAAPVSQHVDLTYFVFLGGKESDGDQPTYMQLRSSISPKLSKIPDEVLAAEEFDEEAPPRRSLSARLSAKLARNRSMDTIPEDRNVAVAEAPPVRNISNNPHAVDLTWFQFLGGTVVFVPPKKSGGMKLPGILKGGSSRTSGGSGDRKSVRISMIRPEIPSAGNAVSAATSGLVKFIRKARKSVFQINAETANHITALRQEHVKIEDLMLVEHFASWFANLTGEQVRPDHFCEDLSDGVVLCQVVNQIPGAKLKKYFKKSDLKRMTEFRKRENIQKFAKACKSIGIHVTPTYADFKEKSVHNVVPVLVELVSVIHKEKLPIGSSMPQELRA